MTLARTIAAIVIGLLVAIAAFATWQNTARTQTASPFLAVEKIKPLETTASISAYFTPVPSHAIIR